MKRKERRRDERLISSFFICMAFIAAVTASRAKLSMIEILVETCFLNICLGAFRAVKRDYTNHIRPPFPMAEQETEFSRTLYPIFSKAYNIIGYSDIKSSVLALLELLVIMSCITLFGEIPTTVVFVFSPTLKLLFKWLVKVHILNAQKMIHQTQTVVKNIMSKHDWKISDRLKK